MEGCLSVQSQRTVIYTTSKTIWITSSWTSQKVVPIISSPLSKYLPLSSGKTLKSLVVKPGEQDGQTSSNLHSLNGSHHRGGLERSAQSVLTCNFQLSETEIPQNFLHKHSESNESCLTHLLLPEAVDSNDPSLLGFLTINQYRRMTQHCVFQHVTDSLEIVLSWTYSWLCSDGTPSCL